MLLRELRTFSKENKLTIVNVSSSILSMSIKLVFKHHIYVADALQIVSAKSGVEFQHELHHEW